MKKRGPFDRLVKELSRDPRLKQVINRAKRRQKKDPYQIESRSGFFLLTLAIVSRFVSKKKARTLDELMDIVFLLVQVSLLLKENIFDRPEVKDFLSRRSKHILSVAREYVEVVLAKAHEVRSFRFRRT